MKLFSQRWRSDGSLKICCCYCLLDVILIIFVGALCWLLFSGFVPPYKRGFYCHDQSIRLSYKPNTVSVSLLLIITIGVPIVLVVWYNLWIFFIPALRRQNQNGSVDLTEKLRTLFAVSTSIIVEYFFGLMIVIALMHFGKSTFGVLRPHFIDVCRPNTSLISCDFSRSTQQRMDADDAEFGRDGSVGKIIIQQSSIYVEEPHCTTNDHFKLKVARESFPSGHTAVAVYALLFAVIFIRDRSRRTGNSSPFDAIPVSSFCPVILKYGFLLIYTSWTVFVCVTRVTDNWHHWTDVAGGLVLGLGVGAVIFLRKDSALRTGLLQGKAADY